jgi:hypothetical protein
MAATVKIVEKNGAGGTQTDKTSGTIRFKNADNATVDTSNRMVVPGSGSDYSYEKWLRFQVDVAPSVDLQNLKFYTDGSNGFGTGINLYAKAVTTYATPAEATATAGYADAFTYTSAAPLSLGAGPFTSTGEKGDHCVMMLKVDSTAAPGLLSTETLTFSYDET